MLVRPGLQPAVSCSADRRLSNRANRAAGKGKLAPFSTKGNVLLTPNPSYFSAINFHPRPHLPYIDPKWTLTLPSTFFFPPPHLYCFPPAPPPRFFIVFLFHHHRHRISTVFPPPTQPPPHHTIGPILLRARWRPDLHNNQRRSVSNNRQALLSLLQRRSLENPTNKLLKNCV